MQGSLQFVMCKNLHVSVVLMVFVFVLALCFHFFIHAVYAVASCIQMLCVCSVLASIFICLVVVSVEGGGRLGGYVILCIFCVVRQIWDCVHQY
jgi:hypothetical protein